jgi:hypothetical protein
MEKPLPTAAEAAHRILASARDQGEPGEDAVATVGRVFARLRDQLGRWIGADSFDALASRACGRVRTTHPLHAQVTWSPQEDPPVRGLQGSAAAVLEGGAAVVVALTDLLGRFVGPEMAVRLLLDGWLEEDDASAAHAEEEEG